MNFYTSFMFWMLVIKLWYYLISLDLLKVLYIACEHEAHAPQFPALGFDLAVKTELLHYR